MRATLITTLSKRITIPRLSPTHTSARIVRFLAPPQATLTSYDPIMVLECSSDLVADPADRAYPDQQLHMLIETCEEGSLGITKKEMEEYVGDGSGSSWLSVGTELGVVEDGDDVDGDWIWQGYLHDEDDEKESGDGVVDKEEKKVLDWKFKALIDSETRDTTT